MGVIFDIISSFVIKGIIIVTILQLMMTLNSSLTRNNERVYLNEQIGVAAEYISNDLYSAGFHAFKVFPIAQSNEISFYADTNNDSISETIRYYLSSPESGTNHKTLYRTSNSGAPYQVVDQVDSLYIRYFRQNGTTMAYGYNISNIKSIFIRLITQSRNYNLTYNSGSADSVKLKAIWERHIFPQNL
jgi:hypothetical protein